MVRALRSLDQQHEMLRQQLGELRRDADAPAPGGHVQRLRERQQACARAGRELEEAFVQDVAPALLQVRCVCVCVCWICSCLDTSARWEPSCRVRGVRGRGGVLSARVPDLCGDPSRVDGAGIHVPRATAPRLHHGCCADAGAVDGAQDLCGMTEDA